MTYADYTYYSGTYMGAVSENDFPRLVVRASSFLDYYTQNRAKDNAELDAVKMCCCALVDKYQLIEAAQHHLPMIIRDLPVFREIAGEHAFYFQGMTAEELADAVQAWLELHKDGKHPTSATMPWLTWEQSAEQLKAVLTARQ